MSSRATPRPSGKPATPTATAPASRTTTSTPPMPTASTACGAAPVTQDKIAMRAYEKWCQRGRPHGTEHQDWFEAEQELLAELQKNGRTAARK